jgi:predicted nuclease of predicted toxin-antitoxin system
VPRSRKPPEPPEFFVDRSLGRHVLPDALHEAGFVAHTLASVYGEERAQEISDEEWLAKAGTEEWVVFTKDDAIRRRSAELAVVQRHDVKVFCLTTANLRGDEQRDRFLTNINRIVQRSRKRGPWICGVYEDRVVRIWPAS